MLFALETKIHFYSLPQYLQLEWLIIYFCTGNSSGEKLVTGDQSSQYLLSTHSKIIEYFISYHGWLELTYFLNLLMNLSFFSTYRIKATETKKSTRVYVSYSLQLWCRLPWSWRQYRIAMNLYWKMNRLNIQYKCIIVYCIWGLGIVCIYKCSWPHTNKRRNNSDIQTDRTKVICQVRLSGN